MASMALRDAFGGGDLPILNAVDVGASLLDGAPRWRPMTEAGLMRVWGFEPDDAQFARLKATPQPGVTPVKAALGDGAPATLHICRYPGCSSIFEPDETVINQFTGVGAEPGVGNFAVVDRKLIETRRLEDVDIPAPHYIKLDVQGAELAVLEGGGAALSALCVAECEVCFLPLYRDQPPFHALLAWFAAHGFILHKIIDLVSRAYRPVAIDGDPTRGASQWLWADAVFVRDPRPETSWPAAGRLGAAMILHALYRSYDLALSLLRAHDAEAGEERALAYGRALKAAPAVEPWLTNIRHG